MNPSLFCLRHTESNSTTYIEFIRDKKRGSVKVNDIALVRGNVIPLAAYQAAKKRAKEILWHWT